MTKILMKKCERINNRKFLFKDRLCAAEQLTDKYLFEKYSSKMKVAATLFMQLQVRETNKSSHG